MYGTINLTTGKVHHYLGMTFDFSDSSSVKLSMSGYIDELMTEYKVTGEAKTPATDQLFHINDEAQKLDETAKQEFHSATAKLLYLAKRIRPDISNNKGAIS